MSSHTQYQPSQYAAHANNLNSYPQHPASHHSGSNLYIQGWPSQYGYPAISSRPSSPYYADQPHYTHRLSQPQHQPPPQGQVLFLNRHSHESTLSLRAADGRPLYSCIATERSSLSSKPDYIITHGGSNRQVGTIRYHHWTETGLDYWAVHDIRDGAGIWDWRVAALDKHHAQWTCYRKTRYGPSPAIAKLDFDCDARKSGAVGRCELYDGSLLMNPARQREMDELYVTAVVTVHGTFRKMKQTKEQHGEIKDWVRLAKALNTLSQAGGHGGGDGSGSDGSGGDGGSGGGAGDGGGGGAAAA